MDEQEQLARNLIKFRKAANLTQIELANKIKYSNKTVSKWERAEGIPDIFTLQKIAAVYNVKTDDLLEGVNSSGRKEYLPEANKKEYVAKRAIIFMSCAALLCLTIICFFLLTFLVGSGHNADGSVIVNIFSSGGYAYWAFFVYNVPLDALAIYIFILVVHHHSDRWSLSLVIWGLLASLHLSLMQYQPLTALIYVAGAPCQLLCLYFCKYLNISMPTPSLKDNSKDTKQN